LTLKISRIQDYVQNCHIHSHFHFRIRYLHSPPRSARSFAMSISAHISRITILDVIFNLVDAVSNGRKDFINNSRKGNAGKKGEGTYKVPIG